MGVAVIESWLKAPACMSNGTFGKPRERTSAGVCGQPDFGESLSSTTLSMPGCGSINPISGSNGTQMMLFATVAPRRKRRHFDVAKNKIQSHIGHRLKEGYDVISRMATPGSGNQQGFASTLCARQLRAAWETGAQR